MLAVYTVSKRSRLQPVRMPGHGPQSEFDPVHCCAHLDCDADIFLVLVLLPETREQVLQILSDHKEAYQWHAQVGHSQHRGH